jgi:hypothetical protein
MNQEQREHELARAYWNGWNEGRAVLINDARENGHQTNCTAVDWSRDDSAGSDSGEPCDCIPGHRP